MDSTVRRVREAAVGQQALLATRQQFLGLEVGDLAQRVAERAADAAEALGITAHRLKALGLIDKIVNEPVGGAHRDPKAMASSLKRALGDALRQVADLKPKDLLARRQERLLAYGRFADTTDR